MKRRDIVSVLLAALALLIALPAVIGIGRVDDGLQVRTLDLDGTPVTVLSPASGEDPRPGVVVAHGFAASSVIMEPLGRVLARAGYVVALPDLSGHGANTGSLGSVDSDRSSLQQDLRRVIDWLTQQSDVDPSRLALVGHSMGAGAVTRFAIDDPDIVRATVAISLPAAVEPVNRPRDLLLLYGANEPATFSTAALEQLRAIQPDGEVGTVYGDIAQGTGIAAEVIPAVEHISIVWSPVTATAMLEWIGSAVDQPTAPVNLDPAWRWLILLLVAGAIAAVPLARVLYGSGGRARPEELVRPWVAIAITLGSAVVASLIAWAVGDASEGIIPIAVGGYLGVWFAAAAAMAGAAMLVLLRRRHRRPMPLAVRDIAAGLVMTGYAVALLILSARATWATAQFIGPRLWVWVVLSLILLGYFYADAAVLSRGPTWARSLVMLASRAIVVIALLASVVLLGAPTILTLLIPFMVLLFIVLGYLAIVISTQTPRRFGPALVQAVPLAAVVASGFPLV